LRHLRRCYTAASDVSQLPMKLSKLVPPPFREFLRRRLTIYVYTYGFRPSRSIAEQTFNFVHCGRSFSVKADHRTALYDMIAEVVDYDCYQLKKLGWEPGGDRYIVDIGANVGVTALVLSQMPGAHVVSYEPDAGNCDFLRGNIARNGVSNVKVVQAAVAASDGALEFQTDAESTGGRLIASGAASSTRTVKVDAVSLTRVVEQFSGHPVDLIKCDCEGGEYAIIDQLTPAVAERVRNLSIEVHDLDSARNLETISAKLSSLGYRLSCIPDMWERSALHLLLARRPG
jgi:FkbM family methyltransferase